MKMGLDIDFWFPFYCCCSNLLWWFLQVVIQLAKEMGLKTVNIIRSRFVSLNMLCLMSHFSEYNSSVETCS